MTRAPSRLRAEAIDQRTERFNRSQRREHSFVRKSLFPLLTPVHVPASPANPFHQVIRTLRMHRCDVVMTLLRQKASYAQHAISLSKHAYLIVA